MSRSYDPARPAPSQREGSAGLRTPEELLGVAFARSRVVLVNEAYDGMRRCLRTRVIGRRLLPTAHALGVRHLAMEALWDREWTARANAERRLPPGEGYLAQPDLRALVQDALDLGWTLASYEAEPNARPSRDTPDIDQTNLRELEQARNLAAVLPDGPLLVWCGNGHLSKIAVDEWQPMGHRFAELTGIEPFALDQTVTCAFEPGRSDEWTERFRDELEALGGTAGFLAEAAPEGWYGDWADAFVLSVENELE